MGFFACALTFAQGFLGCTIPFSTNTTCLGFAQSPTKSNWKAIDKSSEILRARYGLGCPCPKQNRCTDYSVR